MEQHSQLIEKFYSGFQELNSQEMADCYHEDVEFKDPAFGVLKGKQRVVGMWDMLISRSNGQLIIHFDNILADEQAGFCDWEAYYTFAKTGRKVHNKIKASFRFKDGLIIEHHDHFNFWRWSSMALGWPGMLLGFSPIIKNKVRGTVLKLLDKHLSEAK